MKRDFSRGQLDREGWRFYPRLWASLGPVGQEAVLDTFERLAVRIECGRVAVGAADRIYQAYARLRMTILDTSLDEADFWQAQLDHEEGLLG